MQHSFPVLALSEPVASSVVFLDENTHFCWLHKHHTATSSTTSTSTDSTLLRTFFLTHWTAALLARSFRSQRIEPPD
jgi:hypothetical protein